MIPYNYRNIATIIVDKIIEYQIKSISENQQFDNIIMLSESEYEYKDYIFSCETVPSKYEPKYLNLQLAFKWFVTKKSHLPLTKILFGSIYQHYVGNDCDILVLNSDLDLETLNEYHNILQIIYAYIRESIDDVYDSVLLDYIKENNYLLIPKYELYNQIKLEYEKYYDNHK